MTPITGGAKFKRKKLSSTQSKSPDKATSNKSTIADASNLTSTTVTESKTSSTNVAMTLVGINNAGK